MSKQKKTAKSKKNKISKRGVLVSKKICGGRGKSAPVFVSKLQPLAEAVHKINLRQESENKILASAIYKSLKQSRTQNYLRETPVPRPAEVARFADLSAPLKPPAKLLNKNSAIKMTEFPETAHNAVVQVNGKKRAIISSILAGLVLAGVFSAVLFVFAVPPDSKYDFGATLDPNCSPGDTNCSVVSPAQYSFSANDFSGTGGFTTTGAISGGGITGTSFIIGANTLTTAEWAYLDGQDQAVKTISAPTFATGTIIGALTLADGSITDSSGTIDFGNENLTTSGNISTSAGRMAINAAINSDKMLNIVHSSTNDNADNGLVIVSTMDSTVTGDYTNKSLNYTVIASTSSGVTNSGGYAAVYGQILGDATHAGTLTAMYGFVTNYGHDTGTTGTTTNAYGFYVRPYYQGGTVDNMYNIFIQSGLTGGTVTNKYDMWSNSGWNWVFGSDNQKIILGGGQDASIYYDGSDMYFNSREVGTGDFIFSNGLVGIQTTNPTNILSLGGDAARTIWMERNTTTSGSNLTLESGGALSGGTNLNGGNLYLSSGISTGSGSSDIFFQAAAPGASGTADSNPGTALTVRGRGSVVLGTGALATNATDGFLYIPSSAGTPSGTPTTETGRVPIQYDTTNNRIYAYRGGAWRYFAETGGFQIPDFETIDPISGEQIREGDIVLGMIDKTMSDSALHATWVTWNSVKKQLLAEARGSLSKSNGALGTGAIEGVETGTFFDKVKNILFSLGITFEDGLVSITRLATQKLFAKNVRVETLEIVDKTTGEVWCTWIENGEWQKTKGECGAVVVAKATTTAPTSALNVSSSTPGVEEAPVPVAAPPTSDILVSPASQQAQAVSQQAQEIIQQAQQAANNALETTEHARQAIEEKTQAVSQQAAESASKAAKQAVKEVKEEIKQELKEEAQEAGEQVAPPPPEASAGGAEQPAEEAQPEDSQTEEQVQPTEETPPEQVEETPQAILEELIPPVGELIQDAAAGLLNSISEFLKWMLNAAGKNASSFADYAEKMSAGLLRQIKELNKSIKTSLEHKTPAIIKTQTASAADSFSVAWKVFVKIIADNTPFNLDKFKN